MIFFPVIFASWSFIMNKHLFGIFTYFATFFISFALVALFGVKEKPVVETYTISTIAPLSRNYETVDQREIRKLLDNDRSFGLEYYARAEQPESATELVEKMRELNKNSQLPPQIRKAYANHLEAWNNQAKHVNSQAHLSDSDRLCPELDAEITKTYDELLDTAEDFGVVFPR